MDVKIIAAMIAAGVSIFGIIVNTLFNQKKQSVLYKQWQEGFRAELRRDLFKETAIDAIKIRLELYGEVWRSLKITSGYYIKRSQKLKEDIQKLADELSDFAYGQTGLLMTDRSRRQGKRI